jgi:gluconokinase
VNERYMGVDIGTTGVRAALFDVDGFQRGYAYQEYPLLSPETGAAELDPETVFAALLEVVGRCMAGAGTEGKGLKGIGLSTQMFSFLALDAQGTPLTNVVTWADTRPLPQALRYAEEFDVADLYRRTGCRTQHPMYPLAKILWLKETRPDVFERAAKFLSLKSYMLFRLFGRYVVDYTDASASSLFNLRTFDWDPVMIGSVLGIGRERLCEPMPGTGLLTGMDRNHAVAMGLPGDVPVACGAGDGIVANLGCGVFDATAMSCTLGTSGALRVAVDQPLLDPLQRTWCHCFTKDTWVAGGAINNGGLVLKWLRETFRDQFAPEAERGGYRSVYALFDAYAGQIPAGSDGLLFLPLLTGERSPNWNAAARGVMAGLDLRHDRRHFVKAAMEGVMYRMRSVYEVLAPLAGDDVRQIRANGGYAGSEAWLRIQADVFGKEIAVAGVEEAASFGAAVLAMVGTGALPDLKRPLPAMQVKRTIEPDPANAKVYETGFRDFLDLYGKMYGA